MTKGKYPAAKTLYLCHRKLAANSQPQLMPEFDVHFPHVSP